MLSQSSDPTETPSRERSSFFTAWWSSLDGIPVGSCYHLPFLHPTDSSRTASARPCRWSRPCNSWSPFPPRSSYPTLAIDAARGSLPSAAAAGDVHVRPDVAGGRRIERDRVIRDRDRDPSGAEDLTDKARRAATDVVVQDIEGVREFLTGHPPDPREAHAHELSIVTRGRNSSCSPSRRSSLPPSPFPPPFPFFAAIAGSAMIINAQSRTRS